MAAQHSGPAVKHRALCCVLHRRVQHCTSSARGGGLVLPLMRRRRRASLLETGSRKKALCQAPSRVADCLVAASCMELALWLLQISVTSASSFSRPVRSRKRRVLPHVRVWAARVGSKATLRQKQRLQKLQIVVARRPADVRHDSSCDGGGGGGGGSYSWTPRAGSRTPTLLAREVSKASRSLRR